MDFRIGWNRITVGFEALLILVLSLVASVPARAQVAGATLTGTVTDSSGAVIPGAQVSIKHTATGVTRIVMSDSQGLYSAPNLLPGSYDLTVSKTGFSSAVQSGVTLTVGATQLLNFTLQVGHVTQKVQVTTAPPSVQLTSSTISAQVNSTTVRELPLNGRDWTQLATLQPGIIAIRTQASTGSTANRGNRGFGNQLSDSGHRPSENNYRVNGISINDYSNSAPGSVLGVSLGVDAIQEFSVLTTDYSAAYGRTSGAVINAITKSGANQFHGDAYEFVRNSNLDAANFFDNAGNIAKPPFRRNQFGVSGGGPIKKDKAFIFGDYEGIRQDQSLTFHDFVPSPDAHNGILHNADGTTTSVTVDPLVAPFLTLWPLPNGGLVSPGNVGVFTTSGLATLSENYFTVRADQHMSDTDSLAESYFFDNAPLTQPDALVDSLNEVFTRRQMASFEETHIFSPTLVNTFRMGWNRTVGLVNQPVSAINPLAKNSSLAAIPGRFAPVINVPGLTSMSGGFGSLSFFGHHGNSAQVYDDAFITKGNHSLKFGFAFERDQYNVLSAIRRNGSFNFPSLSGFLTNQPTEVTLLNPNFSREAGDRSSLFGGYLQDDWRARSNLTLNLGLRYEMVTLPTEAHGQFQVVQNFYGGLPVPAQHLWQTNNTTKDFEPRVGFAWDPFKTGRTAVRGGFGIFDVLPLPYIYSMYESESYPFAVQTVTSLLGHPGSFPTGAIAISGINSVNIGKIAVRYVDQNPRRSYAMNWNLNIQRDLGWNTSVMVGYVGSRSVHQTNAEDDSNAVAGTLTAAGWLWPLPVGSGTRMNPNVGNMYTTMFGGYGSYDGLQAQISKRMSHGMQAEASYTWGHCIDNESNPFIGDPYLNSQSSFLFFIPQDKHGNCDFDLGQNLVFNYIWDVPAPKFSSGAANWITGGWEVGGIVTASTSTPFTPLLGGDPLGQISDPWPYADRLNAPGCADPINAGNPNAYIKLNCFSPPVAPPSFAPLCQAAAPSVASVIPNTCMNLFGNAGRNQLFGPGLAEFDFSIFKNNYIPRISETFNIQFRAEFFNILNRANFQSPIDNSVLFNQDGTPVGGAGAIDATTTTSRQIQFGLKVIW